MKVVDPHVRRASAYVRPYLGALAPVVVLSLLATVLGLVLPYLSKLIVDDAILDGDFRRLLVLVGVSVAITGISFGLDLFSAMRCTKVSADVLLDMRLELYRHLQRLSPRFYAKPPLDDIVSRIDGDIGEIQRVTAEAVRSWLGQVVAVVGAVGMLIYLDWRLALVGLAAMAPSLWPLVRYRRQLDGRLRTLRDRTAVGTFLPGLLLATGTGIVFAYGGYRVIAQATTLGTLVAFMAYQVRLVGPVRGLVGIHADLTTARASLERVYTLLDTAPDVEEATEPLALPTCRGRVVLKEVHVDPGRRGGALHGIDLEIPAGQTVAIVGPRGSGKSTVADLLGRQIDPDRGRVTLDGHDLRELKLDDVRRHVAVVEQDPFVFPTSIVDNVRYARPDAADTEVADAIEAAGLNEVITSMPEGAPTPVGERGRQLSAGERQRVALARAFLADPAVLVMDEASGALDPSSEAVVLQRYERALGDRTTIIVTHRLDLARQAERVVVLEGGQIEEDGPASILEERGRLFRELFVDVLKG